MTVDQDLSASRIAVWTSTINLCTTSISLILYSILSFQKRIERHEWFVCTCSKQATLGSTSKVPLIEIVCIYSAPRPSSSLPSSLLRKEVKSWPKLISVLLEMSSNPPNTVDPCTNAGSGDKGYTITASGTNSQVSHIAIHHYCYRRKQQEDQKLNINSLGKSLLQTWLFQLQLYSS